ncbi:hypothetical protein GE061_001870 [Apolygus lucorum]|uniref:Peptidase S1 domain-containing protein n=1 Tax=Apolygus lucorum TaxID=248454 RepID=A0A8S9X579_APOLU|nr:hypothetical protein GE061_001870 [Apolygus lucorum]
MHLGFLGCCSLIYWIGSQATISAILWKINTVEVVSGEQFGREDASMIKRQGRRLEHENSADIPPGKYPFLGLFFDKAEQRCAATLTTPKMSMTSCHCLVKDRDSGFKAPHKLIDPKTVELLMGAVYLTDSWGVRAKPDKLGVHPECQIVVSREGFTITYDYGILLFPKEIPVSKVVSPLSLPNFQERSLIDEMVRGEVPCVLIGWGKTDLISEGNHSVIMTEDEGKLKTREWCGKAIKEFGIKEKLPVEIKFTDTDICASVVGKNKSVCGGDLGGPLLCGTAQKQMIGVVSWSPKCAVEGDPIVYNRLDIANDWINQVMENGLSSARRLYVFNWHVISSAAFSIMKYIRFMA